VTAVPVAEAEVATPRASRYLVQLCRHFESKASQAPDFEAHVERSETSGVVTFIWGQCTMRANPESLVLRVEASGEENLEQLKHVIARHIEGFGQREHLEVRWYRG
jgi:hypothetical protein